MGAGSPRRRPGLPPRARPPAGRQGRVEGLCLPRDARAPGPGPPRGDTGGASRPEPAPGAAPPCGPTPALNWPEGHSRPDFSSHTYLDASDIFFRLETGARQTPLPTTSARAPICRAASLTHRGSARSDLAAAAAVASAAASADNMADLPDGGLTRTNALHRTKRVLNPHAPFPRGGDRG